MAILRRFQPLAFGLAAHRFLRRFTTGDTAEHDARHQAGAQRVVVVEQTADHLAAGVQARDGFPAGGDDPRLLVDLQAAEGEGDTAGNRP